MSNKKGSSTENNENVFRKTTAWQLEDKDRENLESKIDESPIYDMTNLDLNKYEENKVLENKENILKELKNDEDSIEEIKANSIREEIKQDYNVIILNHMKEERTTGTEPVMKNKEVKDKSISDNYKSQSQSSIEEIKENVIYSIRKGKFSDSESDSIKEENKHTTKNNLKRVETIKTDKSGKVLPAKLQSQLYNRSLSKISISQLKKQNTIKHSSSSEMKESVNNNESNSFSDKTLNEKYFRNQSSNLDDSVEEDKLNNLKTNYKDLDEKTSSLIKDSTLFNKFTVGKTFKSKLTSESKLSKRSTIKQGGITLKIDNIKEESDEEKGMSKRHTIYDNTSSSNQNNKNTIHNNNYIQKESIEDSSSSNTENRMKKRIEKMKTKQSKKLLTELNKSKSKSSSSNSFETEEEEEENDDDEDKENNSLKSNNKEESNTMIDNTINKDHDSINSHSFVNSVDFGDKSEESLKSIRHFKPFNHESYDIFSLARHGRFMELEAVLLHGLDPDSRDMYGNTILIVGAQNNNKRIIKLALRYGGQINMYNHMGNTALHYASQYQYYTIIDYLIKKGANPRMSNFRGLQAYEGVWPKD